MINAKLLSSLKLNTAILKQWHIKPITPAGITDGDRVRFWTNYNSNLAHQISIIKQVSSYDKNNKS